jgi:hypothetical protein
MLAEINIRQNKLDKAKDACSCTLKARSRLLGKQHEAYLDSIALMSRICELSGEDVYSKVYLFRIPEEQRERLTVAMSRIQPSNVDIVALSTPITTQVPSAGAVELQTTPTARFDSIAKGAAVPVSDDKPLQTSYTMVVPTASRFGPRMRW